MSLLLHLLGFGVLDSATEASKKPKLAPVKIAIVEKPKAPAEPLKKEEPKPPPPKPKEKPPVPKKMPSERVKPQEKPAEPPKPIMGIDPSAVSPDGKGIAAPVGNTLMMEDDGKRVKPEDVKPFTGDLSSDARLIRDSLKKIEYTEGAIEAALEGKYTVDVYVDEKGDVTSAELRKKIGYGMDQRVLDVAKLAKFVPRRTKTGVAEAAWAEILFVLQLP